MQIRNECFDKGGLNNPFKVPLALLSAAQDLLTLGGQIRLATITSDMLKEQRLEGRAILLSLTSFLTLCLFELEFDIGGLGELLGLDGVGDPRPEVQRLVGGLLLIGWKNLGGNIERCHVDDGVLVLGWNLVLPYISEEWKSRCFGTYEGLGTEGEHDLFPPRSTQASKDILLRNILYTQLVIVLGVILENDSINLVCRSSQPSFIHIMKDDLDLGVWASDIRHFTDRNTQTTTQQTAEMRRGVRKLVLLASSPVHGNEDAQVVLTSSNLDASARELGSDLVKSFGANTLLWARDVEGTDWRVVRCLLCEIGDADGLGVGCRGAMLGYGQRDGRAVLLVLGRSLEAREAALAAGLAQVGGGNPRGIILRLPVTPEELSENRVVWLARLALDVLQILG